jgi:O-antigen ligase
MKGKKSAAPVSFNALTTVDYFNLFIVCLYLLVDFIPKGDAIDYNGPQWLYLGIVNFFIILYLFAANKSNEKGYNIQFSGTFFRAPVLVYAAYFLISGLSFFFAFNQNEFLVCYARLVITFIALINVLIVIQKSEKLFPYIAQVIAVIVLFKSIEALQAFFDDVSTNGISAAILNMKGDTGNKNIFSSGVVVKIPFVLYCLYSGRKLQKIINFVILTVALFTLFLANTRSAFVAVFAEILVYLIFCIYDFFRHKEGRTLVQQLGFFLVPVIVGVLISQITIDTERRITIDQAQQAGYGTFTERVGAINLSDSSSSGRFHIWQAAIALFKDHPLTGVGYGNWKISSIPYERLDNNENSVSVHAHNDFLESFGESGFFGGAAYVLLFLLLPILSFKNLFSKTIPNEKKVLLLLSLLGLAGYFIDAVFNFPMERATMQAYFVLLYALNINENYHLSAVENGSTEKKHTFSRFKIYLVGTLLLILPVINITYQTWQSMIVQSLVFDDINAEVVSHKSYEVNDQFPSLTNVTMWGLSISAIKARYLIAEKKFDEAVTMLNKVAKENPYLYYAEFIKGRMYFENGQYDSAYKYSIIAFDNRPRNLAYFGLLAFTCANKNDSIRIKKAFTLFRKYRQDPNVARAWNNYLYALTVMKYPVPYMLKVADSALALYPTDSVTINNSRALHQMAGDKIPVAQQNTALPNNIPGQPLPPQSGVPGQPAANLPPQGALKDSAIFYDVFRKGNEAFIKSDLKKAIDLYEKSLAINPGFYAAIENIGLSYFLLQDYATAVKYLDKAIDSKGAIDGKAEYYRGIALIDMGKRDEGCQSFLISESKKYYDARRLYDLNCKPPETPPATPPVKQ